MKNFCFFIILLAIFICCQCYENCHRKNFGQGIVKTGQDCKYLNDFVRNRKTKELAIFKEKILGKIQYYCCPISKAEKACLDFGVPVKAIESSTGETSVSIGEFPHYAFLAYINKKDGQLSFDCGGALISESFVLTAAHCCNDENRPPIIVRLGEVFKQIFINDCKNFKKLI